MNQKDIDNMNFSLLAGQIDKEIFKTNEKAYKTIHKIVNDHYQGERSEVIKMIFEDLKNKANKKIHKNKMVLLDKK